MFYIYKTNNDLNGKTYIGQHKTDNLNDNYMGSGYLLRQAFEKYGINNFSKEILAVTETKKNADVLEKVFIALYRAEGKAEYNIADGGQGGLLNEYHRKRIIESNSNRILSFETKLKISESLKGHKDSLEVRLRKKFRA